VCYGILEDGLRDTCGPLSSGRPSVDWVTDLAEECRSELEVRVVSRWVAVIRGEQSGIFQGRGELVFVSAAGAAGSVASNRQNTLVCRVCGDVS
jgi:hypothetical protein